jgi:hypothetical protein
MYYYLSVFWSTILYSQRKSVLDGFHNPCATGGALVRIKLFQMDRYYLTQRRRDAKGAKVFMQVVFSRELSGTACLFAAEAAPTHNWIPGILDYVQIISRILIATKNQTPLRPLRLCAFALNRTSACNA